jgi:hypothetical protein
MTKEVEEIKEETVGPRLLEKQLLLKKRHHPTRKLKVVKAKRANS